MKTAVIILNWNTKDYLKAFLPGIICSCEGLADVYVADSGSSDGSLEWVAEHCPSVIGIPLGQNYGFAEGYNRAVGKVLEGKRGTKYVLLLNSDIQVAPGWLEPLVEHMDNNPGCSACGPKLHGLFRKEGADGSPVWEKSDRFEYAGAAGGYIDRFGYPFCRGRVLSKLEEDRGQYDTGKNVMWVSGACMMTRVSVWEALGGLDSRFFAHMEEIDYCWRSQIRGWKVTVVPESTVWHLGGGTLGPDSPFKLKLNYRNNLLLLRKNLPATAGRKRAPVRIFFRKLMDGAAALVYLIQGRKELFRAVLDAHREAASINIAREEAASGSIRGYMPFSILLRTFIKKDIFHWLRKYENSH